MTMANAVADEERAVPTLPVFHRASAKDLVDRVF